MSLNNNIIISDDDEVLSIPKSNLKNILKIDKNTDSDSDSDSNFNSDSESDNEDNYKIEKKCDNPCINSIYSLYFKRNRINLQPNYQREFTWSFEKMCLFIDSLMKGYVIPTFILYKLSNDEKNKNKNIDFECIDGQHRLKVLQKYMNSEIINIGSYEKYIYWEKIEKIKNIKIKQKIFYELTDEIKIKYKRNIRKMTDDEKNFFDEIQLQFIIIQSKLNDKQKCDIFNRLQNGEKVSSITKVKNISHPITNFLRNNNIISSTIIDEWDEIIKINLSNRKNSIAAKNNYLLDHYTYLLIRLILIHEKKTLDINYLNLNIRKYLENNYSSVNIDGNIEEIYKNIIEHKKHIEKKLNGYSIIAELFIIIFYIKLNNPEKFNNLNKKSIKKIITNYNNLTKYKLGIKDKVVSKDIMNKFHNEIIDIIEKYICKI